MPGRTKDIAHRFEELKRELQKLEFFCKGTVLARTVKCGKPGCPCGADAAQRHGPYWEWTYKAAGKTVNVRLSPEAGPQYRAASRQYRRLKILLNRLEALSRSALARANKAPPSPKHRRTLEAKGGSRTQPKSMWH